MFYRPVASGRNMLSHDINSRPASTYICTALIDGKSEYCSISVALHASMIRWIIMKLRPLERPHSRLVLEIGGQGKRTWVDLRIQWLALSEDTKHVIRNCKS